MKVFILICLLVLILLCSCLNKKNNIIEEFADEWSKDGTIEYTLDDGNTYEFDYMFGQKCGNTVDEKEAISDVFSSSGEGNHWPEGKPSDCFIDENASDEQKEKQQKCYIAGIQWCRDQNSKTSHLGIQRDSQKFWCWSYNDGNEDCDKDSNNDNFPITFNIENTHSNNNRVDDPDCYTSLNDIVVQPDINNYNDYNHGQYSDYNNIYYVGNHKVIDDDIKDDCGVCNGDNDCYGCMDPDSCNYDENASESDPSLCNENCYVCNDTSACNYTTSITTDDGITYGVGGDYELKEDNNLCGYYSDCDKEIGHGVCPKDEYGDVNDDYIEYIKDNCGNCVPYNYQDYNDECIVDNQYTAEDNKTYDCCYSDGYNECNTFNECGYCEDTMTALGDTCSLGAGDFYCLDSEKDDCGYCPENTDKYNNSKGCDDICDSGIIEDDCGECNGSNFYITDPIYTQGNPCDCNGNVYDACGVCGGNVDNEEDCSLSDDKDNVSIILYFTEIDVNVWNITYLSLYPFWKVEMNGIILDEKSNNYPYYDYPYSSGLITSYDINDGLTISTDYNDESLFEETGSSKEYTPQTLIRFDGHIKDLSVNVYDGNGDEVEATIILQ